jgi:hypothetical protein
MIITYDYMSLWEVPVDAAAIADTAAVAGELQ